MVLALGAFLAGCIAKTPTWNLNGTEFRFSDGSDRIVVAKTGIPAYSWDDVELEAETPDYRFALNDEASLGLGNATTPGNAYAFANVSRANLRSGDFIDFCRSQAVEPLTLTLRVGAGPGFHHTFQAVPGCAPP